MTVAVTRHDGWALLRLDREAKRNAMNRATRRAMMQALDALRDVRAIVLTGTGGSFCAGLDLKERAEDLARGDDSAAQEWIDATLAITEHPAVVIAAVNGMALGGGVTLIALCDLAIASRMASIACPEMGFATYPGMAGPAIQLAGLTRKQAAWLVLTTKSIDGAAAERWGLVNQCVEPEALLPAAADLAAGIARFDGVALAETKAALHRLPEARWRDAMAEGQAVNRAIRARTPAQALGRAAFIAGTRRAGPEA